jgi:hypothetical protein
VRANLAACDRSAAWNGLVRKRNQHDHGRVLVAIVAGCKSLAQTEALTAEMSVAARRRLGLARRIADTTLRDLLCVLEPEELRRPLHAESETLDANGRRTVLENRYFVASLPASRLTAKQWLLLVRLHWGVENNCHHTLDTAFDEDDRPWIESSPRGMLVVAILRRLAYTLLALFRSITQRSDERRATPWLDLLRWFYNAVISATDDDLAALRPRAHAP